MTDTSGFMTSPATLDQGADAATTAAGAVRRVDPQVPLQAVVQALPGASALAAVRATGQHLDARVTGWSRDADGYAAGLASSAQGYTSSDASGRAGLLESGSLPRSPNAGGWR